MNHGAHYSRLRNRYRPAETRLLLVGESPPKGRAFFYEKTGTLFEATREAFQKGCTCGKFGMDEFLDSFETLGCFLDDLSTTPINGLERAKRRHARKVSIPSLTKRLRKHPPEAIVIVMRQVAFSVLEARDRAGRGRVPTWIVPFPRAADKRREYVDRLAAILGDLRDAGILCAGR